MPCLVAILLPWSRTSGGQVVAGGQSETSMASRACDRPLHAANPACSKQAFAKMFGQTPDDMDMHVVYDVSHNIAKVGGEGVPGTR